MYAHFHCDIHSIRCGPDQDSDRGCRVRPQRAMATIMSHVIQSLILGGGYGYLTGQHGAAVDNILQVRLVPQDPTIST
jgi:hypothetical protein